MISEKEIYDKDFSATSFKLIQILMIVWIDRHDSSYLLTFLSAKSQCSASSSHCMCAANRMKYRRTFKHGVIKQNTIEKSIEISSNTVKVVH